MTKLMMEETPNNARADDLSPSLQKSSSSRHKNNNKKSKVKSAPSSESSSGNDLINKRSNISAKASTSVHGNNADSQLKKKRKRVKKLKREINEKFMNIESNQKTHGSRYDTLAKQEYSEEASDSGEGAVLSNDIILLDDDEDDRASVGDKPGSADSTPRPQQSNEAAEKEDSIPASKSDPSVYEIDSNSLSANQDFIAFDLSEDEESKSSNEDSDGSDSDEHHSASERVDLDSKEPGARKRKRDLSDDETGANNHSPTIPQKRFDTSLEFPWISRHDHSKETEIADWLTKEIKDFVAYVSPSEAEIHARNTAVTRIRKLIVDLWPDAEVKVFGSYATDMYLPGSDIDMVVLSPDGKYDSRAFLYQLGSRLKSSGIAQKVEVIAKARVPIIKFVDIQSTIHIDVSFERTNGIEAVEIIRSWADEFPCLRYLVVIVKQFLARRKLNNVHNGGMGGYSVICSVVNFLKLHPKVASGVMNPENNLGVLLIEYFELYGKNFNYDKVALKMSGKMGYLIKRKHPAMLPLNGKSMFALAIQDPKDPDNNISRGSFNIRGIKKAFKGAFDMITLRCYELMSLPKNKRKGQSILGDIIRVKGPERDFVDSTSKVMNIARQQFGTYQTNSVNSTPSIDSRPPTPINASPKPGPSSSSVATNMSTKCNNINDAARKGKPETKTVNPIEYFEVSSDDDYTPELSNLKSAAAPEVIALSSSEDEEDNDGGAASKIPTGSAGFSSTTTPNGKGSDEEEKSKTSMISSKTARRSFWATKSGLPNVP
jgi:DNA polymerase sigma